MSVETMLTQTITLIRNSEAPTTADSEGNPTGTGPEVDSPGLIQQRNTTEIRIGRDTLISNHILFLPPDAEIAGVDQARDEAGNLYEIIGRPNPVPNPRLRTISHFEVDLKLVS